MKRIASLFCTVLILLSICTIPASAHEECSFSKNHVPYKVTFSNSIDEHDAAIAAKHAFLASNIQPKAILSYQDMIRIPLAAQRSKSSMLLPHELTDTLRPQELISGFQKNHLSFKKIRNA
jgi:hypothetical protein